MRALRTICILRLDVMGVAAFGVFLDVCGVCQIPAGLIVDRFGVRGAYAGAFVVWSLASASIALSRGSGDIFASRLVSGFSGNGWASRKLGGDSREFFAAKENGLPTAIYIGGAAVRAGVEFASGEHAAGALRLARDVRGYGINGFDLGAGLAEGGAGGGKENEQRATARLGNAINQPDALGDGGRSFCFRLITGISC